MNKLTKKQNAFLAFVRRRPNASVVEIMERFGWKARTTVHWYRRTLEAKGALHRTSQPLRWEVV